MGDELRYDKDSDWTFTYQEFMDWHYFYVGWRGRFRQRNRHWYQLQAWWKKLPVVAERHSSGHSPVNHWAPPTATCNKKTNREKRKQAAYEPKVGMNKK